MVATTRRGWIGIDVGTRAVKLAQLERSAGRLRLVDAAVVPRDDLVGRETATELGQANCRDEIATALGVRRHFHGRAVAGTLSMHWCQAKNVAIPGGEDTDVRALVARQLRGLNCPEKYTFGFWKTGLDPIASEAGAEDVITLVVGESFAEQFAEDTADCGLDCRLLDGLPLVLARAISLAPEPVAYDRMAAIDWGFSELTLCTFSGQTPTFVRRLRGCGFGCVLRQVASTLGLAVDEVESLLTAADRTAEPTDPAVAGRLPRMVQELAARPLGAIVAELQRTWEFLAKQRPAALPEKVWLFGGGGVWPGAVDFLAAKIACPVETWRLESAGIERLPGLPFPDELLGAAVSMSASAWSLK